MTYALQKVEGHGGDSGKMSDLYTPITDEDGNFIDAKITHNARPEVGSVIRVGAHYARSYSSQDWWQTTLITEILKEWTDEHGTEFVEFKTENSTYIWKHF